VKLLVTNGGKMKVAKTFEEKWEMRQRRHTRNDLRYKKYWSNPLLPFHIVYGSGEGGVSILIRKSWIIWLFRLIRFGELSRYVVDGRGSPIVYNHISMLIQVLMRKHKVYGQYTGNVAYGAREWNQEEYQLAYDDLKFGTGKNAKTDAQLIKDPYCHWVKGYKAHFVLEKPFGKRIHHAYFCTIRDWYK